MKLLEILTSPYLLRCECAACFTGTYMQMSESVIGMESDAIAVLADESLYNQLKLGNTKVDIHSRTRFAILLSLVSDMHRKLTFIKNFIKDETFDLDFLNISSIREFNKTSNFRERTKQKIYIPYSKIERFIQHAPIFRRFPELMENKILPYETQKIVLYLKGIHEVGTQYFDTYFRDYFKDELILITHAVFDQYLQTKDKDLVVLIQDIYAKIETSRIPRFMNMYPHSIKELTNKILTQGNHKYLPFKTPNFGAKSRDEYLYLAEQSNIVKDNFRFLNNKHFLKMNDINLAIKNHRNTIQSIMQEIEILEKQITHNNKSEQRLNELKHMCDLSPAKRLKKIINSEHSIHYYPEFMIEDSLEYLEVLTPKEKTKLLTKLKTAKRGMLKKLKSTLVNTL